MRADWLAGYRGRTVAVIASGPSLTADDCEAVKAAGIPAFVVNTTFRMAPWADVLVAHDNAWWREYREEVRKTFHGKQFKCAGVPRVSGEPFIPALLRFRSFGNSGCAAISLAVLAGASRVILLGVDCQRTGGMTHWHGDHPEGLSNAKTLDKWAFKFAKVASYAKASGCEVVNCSRETALTIFPRAPLGDSLSAELVNTSASSNGGGHEGSDRVLCGSGSGLRSAAAASVGAFAR